LPAAESIIKSEEIWLTDYRKMNDSKEGVHGLELATTTISKFADELTPETLELIQGSLSKGITQPFYVGSFSMVRESSLHWEEYGGAGCGVALAFEPLGFRDLIIDTDPFAISMTRVGYAHESKAGLLAAFAVTLDDIVRFDLERGLYERAAYQETVDRLFPELLPICKDWNFHNEHEVRLVVTPSLSRGPLARIQPRVRESLDRHIEYIGTKDLNQAFALPVVELIAGPGSNDQDYERLRALGRRIGRRVSRCGT
jgi:hypothetical protein